MKNPVLSILLISCLALSCTSNNQKTEEEITPAPPHELETKTTKVAPKSIIDTMQFIHFDANGDYWFALFLNKNKDTVRLITDKTFEVRQIGKMMQVKWHRDSLSMPSEDEKKYSAKRLESYIPVNQYYEFKCL